MSLLLLKKRLKLPATSTDVHGMQCSVLRISFLKISSSHSTDLLPEQVHFLLFNLLEFLFFFLLKKRPTLRERGDWIKFWYLQEIIPFLTSHNCTETLLEMELCNYCLNKVWREKAGWISRAQFLQEYAHVGRWNSSQELLSWQEAYWIWKNKTNNIFQMFQVCDSEDWKFSRRPGLWHVSVG